MGYINTVHEFLECLRQEGLKMERLHVSQDYDTWEQAFAHQK